MIEEKFLESAIRIRKNYLKISSNLEFYHKKAKDIIQSLEDIAKKAQGLQDEINNDKKTGVITMTKDKAMDELIRILKELEDEAGLLPGSLAKSALAAADLDKRLSQVSAAGLKFENEEDKQYLANIAAMGKGGKYEVTLEDGTKKDLQSLNQEEFNKLIDQQKNAPKTIEEIQRSQLGYAGEMAADIASILGLMKFALPRQEKVRTNIEGFRNVLNSLTSTTQKKITSEDKDLSKLINDGITEALKLFDKASTGNLSVTDLMLQFGSIQEKIMSNAGSLGDKAMTSLKEILKESASQVKGNSDIENFFRGMITGSKNVPVIKTNVKQKQIQAEPISTVSKNAIMGTSTTLKNYSENFNEPKQVNSKVDLGGVITIKVDAPPGVSQQQLTTYFESESFKRMIYEYWSAKSKELERRK
jgi:hypothetical protein